MRGATGVKSPPIVADGSISIHAPRAGSDAPDLDGVLVMVISIHASPVRGATAVGSEFTKSSIFQIPRSPCGERRQTRCPCARRWGYFNPRSPCGERRALFCITMSAPAISIHAPRAGSDSRLTRLILVEMYFNPRSPCGERLYVNASHAFADDFNPRSPCGERPRPAEPDPADRGFLITLPVRGATILNSNNPGVSRFQSTLPVRGATAPKHRSAPSPWISIHAPRAGSDYFLIFLSLRFKNFYLRSPCGERHQRTVLGVFRLEFQSTLPVRGATLLWGRQATAAGDFNPRSPCGERQAGMSRIVADAIFQSTLPVRGATARECFPLEGLTEFQSTLPVRERP